MQTSPSGPPALLFTMLGEEEAPARRIDVGGGVSDAGPDF